MATNEQRHAAAPDREHDHDHDHEDEDGAEYDRIDISDDRPPAMRWPNARRWVRISDDGVEVWPPDEDEDGEGSA